MPPKINDGLTASQRYNRKHREKRNQQKREHRAKNHEILKQRERDLYHQNKSIIIEELGGKCVNCGTEDNLEFDHIYPQLKQSKLSHLLKQGLERIREESKLCQLLCSNHGCRPQHPLTPQGFSVIIDLSEQIV